MSDPETTEARIAMRLSLADRQLIEEAAQAAGSTTLKGKVNLSAWCVDVLLKEARRVLKKSGKE